VEIEGHIRTSADQIKLLAEKEKTEAAMATTKLLLSTSHGYGIPPPRKNPGSCLIRLPASRSFIFDRRRHGVLLARHHSSIQIVSAYISAPASDPNSFFFFSDKENASPGIFNGLDDPSKIPKEVITWKLIWKLMLEEKSRLVVAALALVFGTVSTLSMPLFSGKFSMTNAMIRLFPDESAIKHS
jgi:hypothetical protein